jgi:2-dehydro-3-deoxyphosphooctonate aldolase (KDO 8-P synthase)
MNTTTVRVAGLTLGSGAPLALIAGPCVIEGETETLRVAEYMAELTTRYHIPYIFKASYDKANRTSRSSYRGPGLENGLRILRRIGEETGVPLISDIHRVEETAAAAQVLDILQIPAFLCRQTDLLESAASTNRVVNLKKGQFLSPWDMASAAEKVTACGNDRILLTERGATFGYNNLVVDFRSIPIMQSFGYPVVFDATHSVQLPGAGTGCSGGERAYAPVLARAAVAAGADAVFMEVHPEPSRALCDGPNALPLGEVEGVLKTLIRIREAVSP